MTWIQYVLYAVFVVPFIWHLARGRFKAAFLVFSLFLLFMLLTVILTVAFLRMDGGGL